MRRIRTTIIGATLLIGLLGATMAPAYASVYETRLDATVDQVRVNRTGAVTVTGTLDCSAVAELAYGGDIPDGTTVLASVHWVATQMVGRNKTIVATYEPGIASICYTNDAAMFGAGPADLEAPWTWRTLYAFPMGTEKWVLSDDGKFSPGPINIEIAVTGVPFTVGDVEYTFYNLSGWDLRATKAR